MLMGWNGVSTKDFDSRPAIVIFFQKDRCESRQGVETYKIEKLFLNFLESTMKKYI